MNKKEMEQLLIDAVRKIQEASGREVVAMGPAMRPVLDMPGFDSLNGVEATVEVLSRLNLQLEFNNAFVEDARALTIGEAAERLMGCLDGK